MIRIRTLQQRFVVYMLLPVALLLAIMGVFGFMYARSTLIVQWEEAAILKLQRAAHHVDMRMARPKEWIRLYVTLAEGHHNGERIKRQIFNELEKIEGVLSVKVDKLSGHNYHESIFIGKVSKHALSMNHDDHMDGKMGSSATSPKFKITMPRYDPDSSNRTVSLITQAVSSDNEAIYQIAVKMDFDFLLQHIPKTGWWESRKAYLIDEDGNILISTSGKEQRRFGESGGYLQDMTLSSMQINPYGTIRGPGHPPSEISGYYRLTEAPWYIVIIAPGEEILKPIIRFRNYYFLTLAFFIIIILLVIKRVTGQTAIAVNQLSRAAERIAQGDFSSPITSIKTNDEIGELAQSFNGMATQLQDRLRLRESINLAKEVQQNLLPDTTPIVPGLDIAARSVYCEETGGDYYDYLPSSNGLHVIVADVAGHGISSALLMSSVRASLRQRHADDDELGKMIESVNRHVAMDVADSGQFVTLFYLTVDPHSGMIEWVRAGHDPGLLLKSNEGTFKEIGGEGLPLGVSYDAKFNSEKLTNIQNGDIVILATDGIWETQNCNGKMFGKNALKKIVLDNHKLSSKKIVDAVFDDVDNYSCDSKNMDDMTLVVVKVDKNAH
jgi:sigma-B regulation protein RsbU (phosphoserine phosphatase)